MMKVRMIEQRDNGVCLFELENDEIKVITSNLGCHVLSVFTKDREGNFGDVVLGFENVEDCWHGDGRWNPFYLSLTRYGRRISRKSLSESCVSFMQ